MTAEESIIAIVENVGIVAVLIYAWIGERRERQELASTVINLATAIVEAKAQPETSPKDE